MISSATRSSSFLRPTITAGAVLRVIAPSGPFDFEAFRAGIEFLGQRYQVRHDPSIFERSGYLAGDDARRGEELRAALADRDASAIVAARGGYGAMRIGGSIDPSSLRADPKLLVGFSDITALHGVWARAGVESLHASMVAALGRGDERMRAQWIAALEGEVPEPMMLTSLGTRERLVGRLLGGNLALLASMVGTRLLPSFDGAVLFIEDVHEPPYRIDRMLTQLRLSDALRGVVAVVAGSFTRSEHPATSMDIDGVLSERLGVLEVPVLSGIPAGHGAENVPLPFGKNVEVDGARGTLRFLKQ